MRVAVFCASANEVEPCYFREAGRLGKRIGELLWITHLETDLFWMVPEI